MKCKTCGGMKTVPNPKRHNEGVHQTVITCPSCKGTGIEPERIGCHKCKYEYRWSTDEPCKSCGDFTKFRSKGGE